MWFVFLLCLSLGVLSQHVNHVVILVDDLGYNDINIGKAPFTRSNVLTPNLMQMTNEGVLFDNFYTGASICTPSRGALLGGQFPPRFNWFGFNRVFLSPGQFTGFPDNMTTLASYLKGCDYATGMTGKWHLGRSAQTPDDAHWMPLQHGFDTAQLVSPIGNGPTCSAGEIAPCEQTIVNGTVVDYYPLCPQDLTTYGCPNNAYIPLNCTYGVQVPVGGSAGPNPKRNAGFCQLYRDNAIVQQPWEIANITQRLTNEALHFFDARAVDQKPFFFYFAHVAVHEPWFAGADFFGKSQMGVYGDMVEEMDWSVGQVLNRLRQPDIGPTIVYWLSDNGAFLEKNAGIPNPAYRTSAGAFRGGKGQHYEGGVRTPAIVWANPQATATVFPTFQRNVQTSAVGHATDIYKTIASQTTCPAPAQPLDGKDLTPLLTGASQTSAWSAPGTYMPIFCENNIVAVRYHDAGNAAYGIPARDLKVLFATVNWTYPALQACPAPNPYVPSACLCSFLIPLNAPNTSVPASTWFQLIDLNANVNEDPQYNILLNPATLQYYGATLQAVGVYVRHLQSLVDSNPNSTTGTYDVRTSTPPDPTALLSCPGDPTTCSINSEAGATEVVLTSSPNPSYFGQQVVFHSTVSALATPSTPITSGHIYYRINTPFARTAISPILSLAPAAGGGSLPISTLPVNSYLSITSEYQGQAPTYLAATSNEYIQRILAATTVIKVTADPANPVIGQVVTITADIEFEHGTGTLAGTLAFENNGQTFQTVAVTGTGAYQATITFTAVSDNAIVVAFTPSSTNFAASISTAVNVHVRDVPTVTFTSNPATNVVIGQPIQYTITVTGYSPSGQITFQPDGTVVQLNGGTATATITITNQLGSVPIAITYSGDINNAAVTVTDSKQVSKATATVTLTRKPTTDFVVVGQPVTFTATVTPKAPSTAVPVGSVQFLPNKVVVPLVNGVATTVIAPEHVGFTEYSAVFLPNPDVYNTSPSNYLKQVVLQAHTTTRLTSSVKGTTRTFTATVTANSPSTGTPYGYVIFHHGFYNSRTKLVNGVATYTVTNFRGNNMVADYDGNLDYDQSSAKIHF